MVVVVVVVSIRCAPHHFSSPPMQKTCYMPVAYCLQVNSTANTSILLTFADHMQHVGDYFCD